MVVVGSSLMVALDGLTAGFNAFIERQFNSLATNVLTLTNSQGVALVAAVVVLLEEETRELCPPELQSTSTPQW
jgi:hypothetical protein